MEETMTEMERSKEELTRNEDALGEDDKANMEACIRDLEAQKDDLESKKLKTVEYALMKEEVIKPTEMNLNVERGISITAEKEKDDKVSLLEDLEKWKTWVEMDIVKFCAMTREKEKETAYLKEELTFVMENSDSVGTAKENEGDITSLKDDEINALKEELKIIRENARKDAASLKERARAVLAQQDEVIVSLKDELELAREIESNQWYNLILFVAKCKRWMLYGKIAKERNEAKKTEVASDGKIMERAIKRLKSFDKEAKHTDDVAAELVGKLKWLSSKDDSDVLVHGIDVTERESSNL